MIKHYFHIIVNLIFIIRQLQYIISNSCEKIYEFIFWVSLNELCTTFHAENDVSNHFKEMAYSIPPMRILSKLDLGLSGFHENPLKKKTLIILP